MRLPLSPWVRGLLVLAAVLAAAVPAIAEPLLSTKAMKALSPAAADRTVRRDLLSVLRPIRERLDSGMLIQMRIVGMGTRPYGTDYAGLCERDELWLKYASTDAAPPPRDQPMQPYGFESHALFHILNPLAAIRTDRAAQDGVWSRACDALADKEDASWFDAPSADDAAQAIALLQLASEQVRSGALKAASCDRLPNDARTCEQMILQDVTPSKIGAVRDCGWRDTGARCLEIVGDSSQVLTIVGRMAGDRVTAEAIESVTVRVELIVT